MDLDVITPKIETEDLLVSIGKNCETPKKQTYRKAEKTLTFKLIKPRKTFPFKPSIDLGLGLGQNGG